MFLIGLIFFVSFCLNLSISSTDTISLLVFTSLSFNFPSFNSIKSFSNSKSYSLTLKIGSFVLLSQYFRFYSLGFPSLYIHKNFLKNLENKKYYI